VARFNIHSSWSLLVKLAFFVAALMVAATGMGYIQISPAEVLRVLAGQAGWESMIQGLEAVKIHVVWEVRLPRILTAAVVGAGLATAGVVFQGILLNPLADPFTLGVSSGAAFGASLSLLLGLSFLGPYTLVVLAFAGAVTTLFAVLFLSSYHGESTHTDLILSGVIVAAILSAGISLIKYLAEEQVAMIIFWLMGSFVGRSWLDAGVTAAFTTFGTVLCLYFARDLNLLGLGDHTAASLGVEVKRTRLVLLVSASLISAACVAVAGIIGFIGLLVPHVMRFLVGPDNRGLLPASALGGAALLLGADTITRAVLPHEVPIGVLTAIIGGPFFCYVYRRRQMGSQNV
jgi:iron complex transport system permease protein